ncbi:ExbD/TolR family protein [Telmatospirillum siberiense]|uniref:Biopolymer transporter ExbD n=1 Tax=Telmatospirillum siberiense TaxID=382514 RepID=A0A2N3PQ38_9PROT|nr:biopolymer transporter ExbD [Telmatospirillum siberiense]PKU22512.1 biopolymer transporter ExbD [Telmatospirillum siberiense]
MAMTIGPSEEGEDQMLSAINTTPLVDVMLVLLIIFLITIPVVTHSVPVALPKEVNQPTQTKPENVNISVDRDGGIFWNDQPLADVNTLFERLKEVAPREPQPEVHIRGDQAARYEFVGRVVMACQRAGIAKVGFITEPPAHGG